MNSVEILVFVASVADSLTDTFDCVTNDVVVVYRCIRRDLAEHHHQAGLGDRLAGDLGVRIDRQVGIQNGV